MGSCAEGGRRQGRQRRLLGVRQRRGLPAERGRASGTDPGVPSVAAAAAGLPPASWLLFRQGCCRLQSSSCTAGSVTGEGEGPGSQLKTKQQLAGAALLTGCRARPVRLVEHAPPVQGSVWTRSPGGKFAVAMQGLARSAPIQAGHAWPAMGGLQLAVVQEAVCRGGASWR